MASIWNKPLPKTFWIIIGCLLAVSMVAVFAYPFMYGTCRWALHRTVTTYSINVRMPFRWVVDESESPVTFHKPESFLFTGISGDSSVSISRSRNPEPHDGKAVLQKMFSMLQPMNQKAGRPALNAPYELDSARSSGISCMVNSLANLGILASCISDDGLWTFQYNGSAVEFLQAQAIMWDLVDQTSPSVIYPHPTAP